MDKQSIRETAVFERTNTSKSDVYGIFQVAELPVIRRFMYTIRTIKRYTRSS